MPVLSISTLSWRGYGTRWLVTLIPEDMMRRIVFLCRIVLRIYYLKCAKFCVDDASPALSCNIISRHRKCFYWRLWWMCFNLTRQNTSSWHHRPCLPWWLIFIRSAIRTPACSFSAFQEVLKNFVLSSRSSTNMRSLNPLDWSWTQNFQK